MAENEEEGDRMKEEDKKESGIGRRVRGRGRREGGREWKKDREGARIERGVKGGGRARNRGQHSEIK